jgi:hypothetical protein
MELVKEKTLIYICSCKSISEKSIRMQQLIIVRRIDYNTSVHIVLFANRVSIDLLSDRSINIKMKKKTNLFSLDIAHEHLQLPFKNSKVTLISISLFL